MAQPMHCGGMQGKIGASLRFLLETPQVASYLVAVFYLWTRAE